jgi:hypothetical protein
VCQPSSPENWLQKLELGLGSLFAFVVFAQTLREVSQKLRIIVWGGRSGLLASTRAADWAPEQKVEKAADRGDEEAEQNPDILWQHSHRIAVGTGGKDGHEDRENDQNDETKELKAHGLTLISQNLDLNREEPLDQVFGAANRHILGISSRDAAASI